MQKAITTTIMLFFSAVAFSQFLVPATIKKDSTAAAAKSHLFLKQTSKPPISNPNPTFSQGQIIATTAYAHTYRTTIGNMWRGTVAGGVIGALISFGSSGSGFSKPDLHQVLVDGAICAGIGTTFCFINGIVRAAKRKKSNAVP
jgi:hypothetical protein